MIVSPVRTLATAIASAEALACARAPALTTTIFGGGTFGGGTITTGRHLKLDAEIPMNNLHLSLLDRMGALVETFGDGRQVDIQLDERFQVLQVMDDHEDNAADGPDGAG